MYLRAFAAMEKAKKMEMTKTQKAHFKKNSKALLQNLKAESVDVRKRLIISPFSCGDHCYLVSLPYIAAL